MMSFEYQLGVCQNVLNSVTNAIDSGIPFDRVSYKQLYDEINKLKDLLPETMVIYRERLQNIILPNLKLTILR